MDKIYELKFGEEYEDNDTGYIITRVPGGWIFYKYFHGNNGNSKTSVFVPFDIEFKSYEKN